jgi:DNA-binding protein HU-beta
MKRRPAAKAPKSAAPKKTAKPAKTAAPKKSGKAPTKKPATKAPAKKPATKSSPDALRRAALEATGLAEKVLQGRDIAADVGLEVKKNAFYAVVRVRVEDLPALLG